MLLIIQLQSLFFLFFYFCSWSFYESFICFQFHHSILICHILFFSIWFLFIWFLIFFIGLFVRLLVFKFILQSKFIVYYFLKFGPHSFKFFCHFVKVIFLFNFTIQFFLGIFVKFLLIFNFIIQSKFIVYYLFQFGFYSFEFFCPFVKVIFLFNFTLQLRICNFPLIYFLFWFLYPFF